MPKVVGIRMENDDEKRMRGWFEAQRFESMKNLEDAARLLIGLVTGLLGALFGVLTVSAETLPAYLSYPVVKGFGVLAVALWLLSLLCGLVVVMPRKWQADSGKPDSQTEVFRQMLAFKSRWLRDSVMLFAGAVISLGAVLVTALISI